MQLLHVRPGHTEAKLGFVEMPNAIHDTPLTAQKSQIFRSLSTDIKTKNEYSKSILLNKYIHTVRFTGYVTKNEITRQD